MVKDLFSIELRGRENILKKNGIAHHWASKTVTSQSRVESECERQHTSVSIKQTLFKVPIAANKKEFVYKIKVNPIHTILKYGDYHDFMDR